jgi:hypothetical protein
MPKTQNKTTNLVMKTYVPSELPLNLATPSRTV